VDGGVVRGTDVASGGGRVLEEEEMGVAEVVEVDELHLLQDRVVCLVPRDERQRGDEAGRHAGAEERADHERRDDADEVQAVLRRVRHGRLLRQGFGHEVHLPDRPGRQADIHRTLLSARAVAAMDGRRKWSREEVAI